MEDIEPLRTLWMWIRLEIRVFFTIIFLGILFLLLSLFRKPNNIFKHASTVAEDQRLADDVSIAKEEDFIKEHSVTFQIFCVVGTLAPQSLQQLLFSNPTGVEKTILLTFLVFQVLLFGVLIIAIFVKKGAKDFAPGDNIKTFLSKTSWVFGILWVASFFATVIFNRKMDLVVAEWLIACVGITLFINLSIFEDMPPEQSGRAKSDTVNAAIYAINESERKSIGCRVMVKERES